MSACAYAAFRFHTMQANTTTSASGTRKSKILILMIVVALVFGSLVKTPGGVIPYKGLIGTCGQPGYVFRDFCLKQGIEFIIFCLKLG